MNVLVLGSGNIGSVAAEDLANSKSSIEVVIADNDEEKARTVAENIGAKNLSSMKIDVTKRNRLIETLKQFDLAMGFLPGDLGHLLAEACVEAHRDLVDVSFGPENIMELNVAACKAGSTIVPDCGLAPGISNVLIGQSVSKLDRVKKVHAMVGGLPEKPVPPLNYVITWSPDSLIDEYTRKARIIRNGQMVEVDALTGIEELMFPELGRLEAFYTDGLRTLLYTLRDVEEMWEKTLRYLGHAEKINTLRALGFFDDKKITADNASIEPRKFTAKILQRALSDPKQRDVVALRTEVSGTKNNKQVTYSYDMLDFQDSKRNITAMARTTAYPASIVAQLILNGKIEEKGVVPPEKIGMKTETFGLFMQELKKRGIDIKEKHSEGNQIGQSRIR
jgi:saccharopine dehydrogenase-like NADP-dependent oxidoreductase